MVDCPKNIPEDKELPWIIYLLNYGLQKKNFIIVLPFVILHINDHICKIIFCSECRLMRLVCIIGNISRLSVDGYFRFNQRNSRLNHLHDMFWNKRRMLVCNSWNLNLVCSIFIFIYCPNFHYVAFNTTFIWNKTCCRCRTTVNISKSRTFNQSMISTKIKRKMAQSPILKTSKLYILLWTTPEIFDWYLIVSLACFIVSRTNVFHTKFDLFLVFVRIYP